MQNLTAAKFPEAKISEASFPSANLFTANFPRTILYIAKPSINIVSISVYCAVDCYK